MDVELTVDDVIV